MKLNRQTDKFTTCGLRKFLERDHHEAEIVPTKEDYQNRSILQKNIGEQIFKKKYADELYSLLLWKVG